MKGSYPSKVIVGWSQPFIISGRKALNKILSDFLEAFLIAPD